MVTLTGCGETPFRNTAIIAGKIKECADQTKHSPGYSAQPEWRLGGDRERESYAPISLVIVTRSRRSPVATTSNHAQQSGGATDCGLQEQLEILELSRARACRTSYDIS